VSDGPPRQIDRYEILSPIGEGGMAAVYHARFTAPGGASKQVALKLIHPHLSQEPELVRMFLDEMRVAMAMSHRNIVQTFDAGRYRDRYYLVMELMNRGSLSGVQPIPLDVAVLVAMEVCAGLDYAHSFRAEPVIHRDVSPANILLSDQGDVKLADFGVAKVRGRLSVTTTGVVKGKLRYMAPEQARGEVDRRSDLFSLGAVLYSLVAGTPLRPNPSLEQARYGVDRVEFPPGRSEAIPIGLQRVIARCLDRELERRPESAAELRTLLGRELELIQLKLGTGGDPLTRLRGFFARRPATVPEPEAGGLARRLADAVMQAALDVPTDPRRQALLEEAETDPAQTGPPARPDDARTAETSVSPIRMRASLTGPPPAGPGRPRPPSIRSRRDVACARSGWRAWRSSGRR
jgi:serine/threonine-protein kinase